MRTHERMCQLLGAALLLSLAACAAGEKALQDKGLKPMTAEQVKAMLATPRTMSWQGNGRSGTSDFRPDGTVSVQVGSNFSDTGRYRIDNGGWCSQYQRIRQGQEGCYRVYQTGPNAYTTVTEQGEPDVTFSWK